ncbi:hypothetical protein NGA_2039500, partial [Nannochloropsis gaditana CCMP526]|uniref:uncharacterized protein n=1 Tax=Nannochloropsis gaditana (strain CCMP526) TaxID=1093141 RepID=UPI00029F5E33
KHGALPVLQSGHRVCMRYEAFPVDADDTATVTNTLRLSCPPTGHLQNLAHVLEATFPRRQRHLLQPHAKRPLRKTGVEFPGIRVFGQRDFGCETRTASQGIAAAAREGGGGGRGQGGDGGCP